MNTQSHKIGARMHDLSINIESNNGRLIEYAKTHLHDLVADPVATPDIQVNCHWSEGEWDPGQNPFPSNGDLNIIGKRMIGKEEELIWLNTLRMKGLQLRFVRDKGTYAFDVAYRFDLRKDKLEKKPEYEYKRYFSLMSYLLYYPAMWYFENRRNWITLHASALLHNDGAILIGGLGGVGKTTTCIGLMQKAGLALISENIVFTDGKEVFPCYEPIRLDDGSLDMLGDDLNGLSEMAFPEGLKDKSLFHVQLDANAQRVQPLVMFLPVFSPNRYVRQIRPEVAAEKMIAVNRLTRELDDYGWYASALDMTWPNPGMALRRVEVMQEFMQGVHCFELGIDRSAGVQAVVDDIMSAVEKATRSAYAL